MLLLPIRLDVLFPRLPVMNYVIIAITTLVTVAAWSNGYWDDSWYFEPWVNALILQDWSAPIGWFGSTLLHGDFFHWFFNMAFLWVFGNAICAKVGNWRYLALYILFTLAASCFHLLIDDSPALGASGSINGIIGFYFALYPINQIKMFYWFLLRPGTFDVTGYWVIAFWLLGDIYGALTFSLKGFWCSNFKNSTRRIALNSISENHIVIIIHSALKLNPKKCNEHIDY